MQNKVKKYFFKNIGINAATSFIGKEKNRKITIEFSSINHKQKLCIKLLIDMQEYIIYYGPLRT